MLDSSAEENWRCAICPPAPRRNLFLSGLPQPHTSDSTVLTGSQLNDPVKFKDMQTKELNNGRLAMIGIAGMVAQELVTGAKLF